jgi:hypothetical protein
MHALIITTNSSQHSRLFSMFFTYILRFGQAKFIPPPPPPPPPPPLPPSFKVIHQQLFWKWELAYTSQGWRLYDMLLEKGHRTRFEDLTSAICHLFPHMTPSWPFAIAIAQPLLNFFKLIYKETWWWYFGESIIIDVHCLGAKMSPAIFSEMLFWEACAKNVKYKLHGNDIYLIF